VTLDGVEAFLYIAASSFVVGGLVFLTFSGAYYWVKRLDGTIGKRDDE
jgi:hypothetical protein